jgi:energy-coupling factor transporter transmembrane protein EcfT
MDIFFTNPIILLVISAVLFTPGMVLYIITKFRLPIPFYIRGITVVLLGLAIFVYTFYYWVMGYNKGYEDAGRFYETKNREYVDRSKTVIDSLMAIIVEIKVNDFMKELKKKKRRKKKGRT